MYALTNCRIFSGHEIFDNHAIIIDGNKIAQICKQANIPQGIKIDDLQGAILSPGFIDLQLNGCGGVQFNETLDALTIETLDKMHATNLLAGCTSFLPTLITSSDEFIIKAVSVMHEYLRSHQDQGLGLHLEGPYISVAKKGIHNANLIRRPQVEMIDFLCANAKVIAMITIAPEHVDRDLIKQLASAGIKVAIGHSNATYEECKQGFADGISCATHLFNAMPYLSGREPGVIGAIYDSPDVYAGIIADGHHVNWANIRNSHKIKGDHLILVTDAMILAGSNLTSATFAGQKIYYQNGRCSDEHGTLGGSSLTMIEAVANVVNHCGIALDEALRMASLYPAKAIGVANRLGSIKEGYTANLVAFTEHFKIIKTIANGNVSS